MDHSATSRKCDREPAPSLQKLLRQLVGGPDIACVDETRCLSYDTLIAESSAVASALQSRGIGPERVVAVQMDRCTDLLATVLAIWRIGGVYLPLDPGAPRDRRRSIIEEARPSVVITGSGEELVFPGVESIEYRELVQRTADGSVDRAPPEIPNQLAYVIYTSGSTGRPKAVGVSRRALANMALQQREILHVRPGLHVGWFASVGFDASVFEMSMALLCGATLYALPERARKDPDQLAEYCASRRLELLTLPPSFFACLDPELFCAGMTILAAGEELPVNVAERWAHRARLFNLYGPTESAIWTHHHRVVADGQRVPIGAPIGGLRAYVLDEALDRCAVGTPGTLYLAGTGVARGYLRQAARTAESFLPDPFAEDSGARMYRSGDLVRELPNGELEFLGRTDRQVKLRGFRIELDEIEFALNSIVGVGVSTVELRSGPAPELWAYVQLLDQTLTAERIRAQLALLLPAYMQPSGIHLVEKMPLTPNGKIDRDALRSLKSEQRAQCSEPSNEVEKILLQAWQQLFMRSDIGIDDPFYSVGGDSILSIQLRAQLRQLGFDFALEDLLSAQTIRNLAPRVTRFAQLDFEPISPFAMCPAQADALRQTYHDAYPLSRMQAGMLFHLQLAKGSGQYHDVMWMLLAGDIDPQRIATRLQELTAEHDILRTAFELSAQGEPLQLVHHHAASRFEYYDLRGMSDQERREAVLAWEECMLASPLDLSRPSLLHVALHRLEEHVYRLSMSCPHAILDGWSAATLTAAILRAGNGRPQQLRFADYIHLEQQMLRDARAREFWEKELCDAPSGALERGPSENPSRSPLRLPVPLSPRTRERLPECAVRISRHAGR